MPDLARTLTQTEAKGDHLPADLVAADLGAVADALAALLAAWVEAAPAVATIRRLLAEIATTEVRS